MPTTHHSPLTLSIDDRIVDACEKGDIDTLRTLLDQGADPNTRHRYTTEPLLLIAAQRGDNAIIDLLIERGADPQLTDESGWDTLLNAVYYQQTDTVGHLITRHGFDPNHESHHGLTPCILAAIKGDIATLERLISLGGDPHQSDDCAWNALHHAIDKHQCAIADVLITRYRLDPHSQTDNGLTPCIIAARNGDLEALQCLAKHGVDPHLFDNGGWTALHHAIACRHYNAAIFLIDKLQCPINQPDHKGVTPFMIAARTGDLAMLKRLIQYGAKPEHSDHNGRNALHDAVENRKHNTLPYLIVSLGLDPNSQDHDGITPLMIAAENGDIQIVKRLIAFGANPYLTDCKGRHLLHYLSRYPYTDLLSYSIAHLHLDPNTQDHDGNTPLHLAIQHCEPATVQTLLHFGANPFIPNREGDTAFTLGERHKIRIKRPKPSTIIIPE